MGERWKKLFVLEESSGMISVTNKPPVLRNQTFHIPKSFSSEIYKLARISTYFSHNDFPLPEKFVLEVALTSDTESNLTTNIEVLRPNFGNPNCDIVDWTGDLGSTWTPERVSEIKHEVCTTAHFGVRPRGVQFTTTAEDTAKLPNQLSQPKENYRIIFKDEFNHNGGSAELDERLWTVFRGKECNNIQLQDGSLSFELAADCTSRGGAVARLEMAPKLLYRYGYLEARFSKVFTHNEHNYGRMLFNSYGPGNKLMTLSFNKLTKSFQREPSFSDFICRGSNRALKRQRWLTSMGTEKQYLENVFLQWFLGSLAYHDAH